MPFEKSVPTPNHNCWDHGLTGVERPSAHHRQARAAMDNQQAPRTSTLDMSDQATLTCGLVDSPSKCVLSGNLARRRRRPMIFSKSKEDSGVMLVFGLIHEESGKYVIADHG
jgi:hypothetical protein